MQNILQYYCYKKLGYAEITVHQLRATSQPDKKVIHTLNIISDSAKGK